MVRSSLRTTALALLIPALAAAQTPRELQRAAEGITPAKVKARITTLAHDSMGGRNTPSPHLEKAAIWLADQYKKFGLQPAGENGTYFQRYSLVTRRYNPATSTVTADNAGAISSWTLDSPFAYATGPKVAGPISGPVVLLGGAMTAKDAATLDLAGKVAVVVHDQARAADWVQAMRTIRSKRPLAILMVTNQAPQAFGQMRRVRGNGQQTLEGMPSTAVPEVTLHDSLLAGDPNRATQPDWAAIRASTVPVVQLAPTEVLVTFDLRDEELKRVSAPNVVAMLPGSDPTLKNEYVVYSSHFDHVGIVGDGVGGCSIRREFPADSICNGADDDASGTTGLVMMAEAFASLKTKPKRTVVFLNVSGEEKGLLGSAYYGEKPTLPMAQTVANLNFDMIGRNNQDSIVVIGKEHSDLGTTLAKVNGRHPELKLTTADDIWPEERFYFRSDHYNFARKGVPILFFFNGVHEDYHQTTDHPEKIDYLKLSKVAKIGFYLGAEIANSAARPQWNPESYKEIVQGPGR
ncbi:MAG TPA: M28 family peptidase [Gemmatimonadales bacterium]|nr:M28 family peptidase [Gemmatimonadales bacterium]